MAQIQRCACGKRATVMVIAKAKKDKGPDTGMAKCEDCALPASQLLEREGFCVEWWEL